MNSTVYNNIDIVIPYRHSLNCCKIGCQRSASYIDEYNNYWCKKHNCDGIKMNISDAELQKRTILSQKFHDSMMDLMISRIQKKITGHIIISEYRKIYILGVSYIKRRIPSYYLLIDHPFKQKNKAINDNTISKLPLFNMESINLNINLLNKMCQSNKLKTNIKLQFPQQINNIKLKNLILAHSVFDCEIDATTGNLLKRWESSRISLYNKCFKYKFGSRKILHNIISSGMPSICAVKPLYYAFYVDDKNIALFSKRAGIKIFINIVSNTIINDLILSYQVNLLKSMLQNGIDIEIGVHAHHLIQLDDIIKMTSKKRITDELDDFLSFFDFNSIIPYIFSLMVIDKMFEFDTIKHLKMVKIMPY